MNKPTNVSAVASYPLGTTLWAAVRRKAGEKWELAPQPYHFAEIQIYIDPQDHNQVKTRECWCNPKMMGECFAPRKDCIDDELTKFFESETKALDFITEANGTSEVLRGEIERLEKLREDTCVAYERAGREYEKAKAEMVRVRERAKCLQTLYTKVLANEGKRHSNPVTK